MAEGFDFPRTARLLKPYEFERVFRSRSSASDGSIIVYCARGPGAGPRLGLAVSKKCGNAVVRNYWKRALREAFRLERHQLPAGLDLVVIPRHGDTPSVVELQASLVELANRAAKRLPQLQPPGD